MFKYLVKFLRMLTILCIIGVTIRVIDIKLHKSNYAPKKEAIIKNATETVLEKLSSYEETMENNVLQSDIIERLNEIEIQNSNVKIKKENNESNTARSDEQEQIKTQILEKKQENETEIEQKTIENQKFEEERKDESEEEIIEDINQIIITEEYKENLQMINKITDIINKNLSEDMKEYGYSIIKDGSIPELTNEFTFTEQRVINKIKYKSGIIRVYARDYYYNGNYINTQCFII